jgi:hypothetical protein
MKFAASAMLVSLSVAGCAATTPPDVLPAFNPADPVMGIRDTGYRPVVVNYNHRKPVGPDNWRRLNERVAPANPEAGS